MSGVRKALVLGLAQNYSALIFQLVSSIFVARLLKPSELGIFSVAVVIVGFAQTVRVFGVPTYIVQEKELTEERIRSAMGVAILVGWLLAGIVALASMPAAAFYREPGVRDVMLLLSVNFLLLPFGSVTMACLLREMNFVPQAVATITSAAVQCGTAIALAYLGFAYMSLAWASVASTLVTILVAQVYRPRGMPYLPSLKDARRVARFGVMSTGVYIVSDATQGAPDLIMGRMLNMESVALLGRAKGLIQMFDKAVMNGVWRVAMPYFSMRDREGADIGEAFLKAASFTTALAWPFFVVLGLLAYPVIRILFGSQWDASVPLVPYLCAVGIIWGPFLLGPTVLTAIGQVGKMMQPTIAVAIAQVTAVLVGSLWDVETVAASLVGVSIISMAWWYKTLRGALDFGFRDFVRALVKSAGVTACAALPTAIVVTISRPDANNLWPPLVLGGLGALVGWLAGTFVLHHPFREEIVRVLRQIRHRGSP